MSLSYKRETYQDTKLSSRGLQDMVVSEGRKIEQLLSEKSKSILSKYGIEHKRNETKVAISIDEKVSSWKTIPTRKIRSAYRELQRDCPLKIKQKLQLDLTAYECPRQTINISNDDVCVKEQKNKRKGISEKERQVQAEEALKSKQRSNGRKNQKKRKYLYQNVTHLEKGGKQYTLIGEGLKKQLNPITAFLLSNDGLNNNWVFFIDGQRTINESIKYRFGWRKIDMILDWYHLDKKISKQFYHAVTACNQRDEIMQEIKQWIWYGLIDAAITCIEKIPKHIIKKQKELAILIGYFERNRDYIKCYAMRKKLALRISSNRVEKTNDDLVANRQKKQGISFTRKGSYSLAVIKSLELNNESHSWIKSGNIKFKFTA